MSLANQFRKSLEDRWLTRFDTTHPDGDKYNGVVVLLQRDYLVLRSQSELAWDGYEVFPKRSLAGFRDGEFEACFNQIHRDQERMDGVECPAWIQGCRALRDVVAAMKEHDVWPGIEILFEDTPDDEGEHDHEDDGEGESTLSSAFYVGPIVDVRDDEFSVHCYDAAGAWEAVYDLGFDEVFRLTFGGTYTTRFNAWMQSKGPARPTGA